MFILVNGQRHPLPGPQTLAALLLSLSPPAPFEVYYGADYFGRNLFPDTTNTTYPGTIIGFGGPGSPNNNNQAIQQAAFDWIQTFWSAPRYGAVQSYVQYSYLTRAPWFVAPSTPKNAHLSMVYAGFGTYCHRLRAHCFACPARISEV